MTTTTCRATRTDGQPCQTMQGLSADGLCQWHDPERRAEAQAAQQKGLKKIAAAKLPPAPKLPEEPMPRLETLEDCSIVAGWIAAQVIAGTLDPRIAREATNAVAQKRFALIAARDVERRMRDFKKRVAALEKDGPVE